MRLKKRYVKRSASADFSHKDSVLKAREYAFLLLKFRLRSECEITERLKRKKFSPEIVKDTVNFLKEKGFIDDEAFCRLWLSSRLKKKLGPRRIEQELKQKGIDKELIKTTFLKLKEDYSECDTIRRIAGERLNKLKMFEPHVARSRTFAYLVRRGFSPEIASETISALCKQTS